MKNHGATITLIVGLVASIIFISLIAIFKDELVLHFMSFVDMHAQLARVLELLVIVLVIGAIVSGVLKRHDKH